MKKILIMCICVLGIFCVGCGSSETKSEASKNDFTITDGQEYEDIKSIEGGYIIPPGKWEVTKLEDSNVINKITLSSNKDGNKEIMYDKAFTLEVEEDEKLILMMAGDGMQLYFEEIE